MGRREKLLSKRRATLEAIKNIGEPVMESQIVVDRTKVDGNGFLIGGVDDELHPMDERWAQIRSLERRAHSRDCQGRELEESTDGRLIYMLSLESRELRGQAQRLKKHRAELMSDELGAKNRRAIIREPRRQSSYRVDAIEPNTWYFILRATD